MKLRAFILVAGLAGLACCPAPESVARAVPEPASPPAASGSVVSGLERSGAPDWREIFAVLARASGASLAANASCDGVVPEVDAPTLADWVGYNLSVLEGEQVHIDAACAVADIPGEWQCDVMFRARFADSPDPWSWGVRFRLRDADRSLVEDSLLCTGAG
jgi:hypothetical protein